MKSSGAFSFFCMMSYPSSEYMLPSPKDGALSGFVEGMRSDFAQT
jgi:hypothetical protein